jgi:hypothetical protein
MRVSRGVQDARGEGVGGSLRVAWAAEGPNGQKRVICTKVGVKAPRSVEKGWQGREKIRKGCVGGGCGFG